MTDELKIADVPEHIFFHSDSFYLGMLYELIEKSLVNDYGLSLYAKGRTMRKFYSVSNPISNEEINDIKKWNKNFNIGQNIRILAR